MISYYNILYLKTAYHFIVNQKIFSTNLNQNPYQGKELLYPRQLFNCHFKTFDVMQMCIEIWDTIGSYKTIVWNICSCASRKNQTFLSAVICCNFIHYSVVVFIHMLMWLTHWYWSVNQDTTCTTLSCLHWWSLFLPSSSLPSLRQPERGLDLLSSAS